MCTSLFPSHFHTKTLPSHLVPYHKTHTFLFTSNSHTYTNITTLFFLFFVFFFTSSFHPTRYPHYAPLLSNTKTHTIPHNNLSSPHTLTARSTHTSTPTFLSSSYPFFSPFLRFVIIFLHWPASTATLPSYFLFFNTHTSL
jgi:hypothetical protein